MWWVELLNSIVSVLDSGGAGGGGAAYESIATVTLGSTASSITLSSIPSNYQHLQLRFLGQRSDVIDSYALRLNGDTGSNYASHYVTGDGSSTNANGYASQSWMYGLFSVGSGALSTWGAGIIDIHDYASSTKNKTVRAFTGVSNNAAGSQYLSLMSGLWLSTSAINSITIGNSSFVAGSTVALYGIKGA